MSAGAAPLLEIVDLVRYFPVRNAFGISAWTPRTISTTCVTRKLTAMLHSA